MPIFHIFIHNHLYLNILIIFTSLAINLLLKSYKNKMELIQENLNLDEKEFE